MLEDIKEIHIEPTSVCNASCPMCARNINGEGLNPYITLKSLDLDWFKKNITPEKIKNVKKIFFCGNVGDPAATPELLEIIAYLKECDPTLVIGLNSNGGLKTANWWSKLGHLLDGNLDYCVFSIDGLEDTNHIHRRNVKWSKVMENAKAFISTGASAHWDMLAFDHNKHQVEEIRTLAKKLGFVMFRLKESDRWDTYTEVKGLQSATPYQKVDYSNATPSCEIERDKSVFIDYLGRSWPCCHIAEAYFNKIGYSLHHDIRKHSLEDLYEKYGKGLLGREPFYICRRACGDSKPKVSQFKKVERFK